MQQPVVIVCLDGMGPDYVDAALCAGRWPRVRAWLDGDGVYTVGRGVLPSFTNPNNMSIVTGERADVHGLCGNHYFDAVAQREVSTEDPACLRCPSLLARLEAEGARVATVTSKEKLRRLLGAGRTGPSFSAERAEAGTHAAWGIERLTAFVGEAAPPIYSEAASTFVLRAGLALLRHSKPDVLYLSTTDYLQHRFAPGAAELDPFLREVDRVLGAMADEGALVAVTADHGMNAKPRVLYLGEHLPDARIVLPITDPYVAHHGALGSCAFVNATDVEGAMARLSALEGVCEVLPRDAAAARHHLPADRIGDVVVFGDASTVLGKTRAHHDLSQLHGALRSHGGPAEAFVPLLFSTRPAVVPTESLGLLRAALAQGELAS